LTSQAERIIKLLPMFLKISGKKCLVVGAGAEGESKIAHLLHAGAKVNAVAPEATETVRAWARAGKITWKQRKYKHSDLNGVYLVVAATSSPKSHREIYREARRRGIMCNVADVPPLCDFYFPAVVRRGPLVIAISTSGQSPALAQRIRKQLERQFGKEYERWIKELGKARKKLLDRAMDLDMRKTLLHQMASQEAFERYVHKDTSRRKARRRN
jgi:precorrin-2 dehydrogenase/sirohydrochlorin ferrochelatase